jgi:hypothetical protein
MVIRFEKRSRKGLVPLFDRLPEQKRMLTVRRLTAREIEHRQRMLDHLVAIKRSRRASQ